MSYSHKRSSSKSLKVKKRNLGDTNSKRNNPTYSDYKKFIREKCAAGYLAKDFSCQPYPSGNVEFCDICGKSRKELEKMIENKFGENWKRRIKEMYCGPIKSAVPDSHESKNINETDFTEHFGANTVTEVIENKEKKDSVDILAFSTLPDEFNLRPTDDKNFTVTASREIKQYTKFGPYVGTSEKSKNSDYYWEFTDSKNNVITKNGESCFTSNWMSRIRKSSSLANCVAWVDGDEVFYKTIKPIQKDQELYVYPMLIPQNTNRNDNHK